VIVAVYVIGGVAVRHAAPAGRGAVAAAVWRSFLGGLRGQALIAATAGAVVAAIASRPRLAEGATWRRLLTGDDVPIRVGLGRSVGLIAAGVAILLEPAAASVTIPTWNFGQQDGTIADQLAYGVRGLLIDTYYGESSGARVRTDLASLPKRETAVQEIGEPAVKAAERLRARIGPAGTGRRGIYLCHGFCELGAVSLDSALADIRSWLRILAPL
jgi:hypothetical protein